MSDRPSLLARLKEAYLGLLAAAPPPDEPAGPRVEEMVGQERSQAAWFKTLVYRIVDEAVERVWDSPAALAESLQGRLDPQLGAALGRPLEEIRALIQVEAPRLINLGHLTRLLSDVGPLVVPERAVLAETTPRPLLAGPGGLFRELLNSLAEVAANPFSVLITGPTGTGKELVARRIHELSPFSAGPFQAVDCAALPENLIEAELFGHEKGAFTGALRARPGKIELAAGGTLFLDEVAELPLTSQVKLLRFLQERIVERLGGGKPTQVRVRVVAATSRDIDKLLAQERFREDLYYRLATLPLGVPPLKDRPEDLPVLIDHYLTEAGVQTGKARCLSDQVRELFLAYDYPGNVRELINLLNHAVAVSRRRLINLDDLPPAVLDKLIGRWPVAGAWLKTLEALPLRGEIRLPLARLLTNHAGGFITNADLRQVLNCSDSTAKTILKRLAEAGVVASAGQHKGRRYLIATTPPGDA